MTVHNLRARRCGCRVIPDDEPMRTTERNGGLYRVRVLRANGRRVRLSAPHLPGDKLVEACEKHRQ